MNLKSLIENLFCSVKRDLEIVSLSRKFFFFFLNLSAIMRAGLSTVQQTLTPEAASILNHAIAEACRRGHGQTTPLHVAATLLAAPASHLRQACIRSHPNSSHPLQCRALELCFSVALDRLPAAQGVVPGTEPPISNALMAALKRAQAHQRRGCPEQQQQPLLAVKVELEQLIVSILDDPSVSRVMREASFSSPAVKATIEQSINMANSHSSISLSSSAIDRVGFRLGSSPSILGRSQQHFDCSNRSLERDDASSRPISQRNPYLNPRLQSAGVAAEASGNRNDEIRRLIEILQKVKKRNPVLVGEKEPEAVIKELVQRIEKAETPAQLQGVQILPIETEISAFCTGNKDKDYITTKFMELDQMVEGRLNKGVILNVGDLRWLVEQPKAGAPIGLSASSSMQQVVTKLGQLLARYGPTGRLWLIGVATCETYLRCQVYHPSMENDWDLQPLPIVAKPTPGLFPRFMSSGIVSNSMESFFPLKGFPSIVHTPKKSREPNDSIQKMNCCSQCMSTYEQELALMEQEEKKAHMLSTTSPQSKSLDQGQQALPQWLQIAKSANGAKGPDMVQSKDQEHTWNQKVEELQKRWNEKCRLLHHHFHAFRPLISVDQSQESLRVSAQAIDRNGRSQNDSTVEKSGIQDPHRGRDTFSITLDSLWRSPSQSKCVMPILSQNNGTLVEGITRSSVTQTAVNGRAHVLPSSFGGRSCELPSSLPGSCLISSPNPNPVATDLALGRSSVFMASSCSLSSVQGKNLLEESHKERLKDMPGCVSSNFSVPWHISPKVSSPSTDAHSLGSSQPFLDPQNRKDSSFYQPTDSDAFKKVYKGLMEKVGWQREAACSVTNVVIQHRSGKGRCRGVGPKGDIWLLFLGPDRAGKRKMAAALSELIFGSDKNLISMKLSSQDGVISSSWNLGPHEHEEYGMNFRGKTTLDRIAEAVRLNPFSVILLEDVDQADPLIRSKLILAMEKGRLPDSHGKEYSLGNIIFVITGCAGSENHHEIVRQEGRFSEERLVAARGCPMQFLVESARFEVLIAKHKRVSVINSMHESESKDDEDVFLGLGIGNKRKADWIKNEQSQNDIENVKKTSKEPFVSLDLNLSVEENDVADFSTASQGHTEACQGSRDSSDLTVEQGLKCAGAGELYKDLSDSVDEKVVFKPFDFERLADKIVESISAKFFSIIGTEGLMEIDIKALEQMLACVWFSSDGMEMFENWVQRVLVRCLTEISTSCAVSVDTVVKLVLEKDRFAGERRPGVPSLPSNISVNIRTKTGQKAGAI